MRHFQVERESTRELDNCLEVYRNIRALARGSDLSFGYKLNGASHHPY